MDNWYYAILSGLPLSVGLLVYILLRDKARREKAEREEIARREAMARGESGELSVKDLEKIFDEKG